MPGCYSHLSFQHSFKIKEMTMMCLRLTNPHFNLTSSFSLFKSNKPSLLKPKPNKQLSFSTKTYSSSTVKMSQTIEHIVLFKVKENTDSSKINTMVNGLNGLSSLDQVLHLSAGPIYRNRSSSFNFTHMLHSRYKSKEDLGNYSAHQSHLSVVRESVLPICDDLMAVDWVADLDELAVVPKSGSVMRVSFLKLKEGLGENEKGNVLKVIGGIKEHFGSIEQLSFGENFSPARAKGFSIASLAVLPGLNELEALDSNEKVVKEQKEKVKELLDSVIVVDYVIQSPQSASL
ncbi:hypothetical protein AQUCO_02000542v1 [Aquilegia coerulea]|uniref:Stress-response A/B barrel domain-containing protein n=1 Tax=Aquilegia coerulea TaxID=218851 RepID=A0A2G5DI30_AQUCA|nr:hypothetical protein AQUCO_02000542v1 [Aquilegia coerulea]PIA43172.1 hypothetical protein AQUCO_02000542v1 [Aquilegia coerulea]